MTKFLRLVRSFLLWLLVLFSALMLWHGLTVDLATSGEVEGSSFGMLITIANELAAFMVWLGLLSLLYFTDRAVRASS